MTSGSFELVGLVVIFDDGAGQGFAFFEAEALGERAGDHVPDHHLDRDDLDFLDELLAHVEAAHEVGWNTDRGEPLHQIFGDAVVEDALAGDDALFLVVEGGGVVLEVLNECTGLRAFEQHFGLAFIHLAAAGRLA